MAMVLEWVGTAFLLVGGMILLAGNLVPNWAGFSSLWKVNFYGGGCVLLAGLCVWFLKT